MNETIENGSYRLKAYANQDIESYAKEMLECAKKMKSDVQGNFNNVELLVKYGSAQNAEDLVNYVREEINRRNEKYEKSPEGLKAAQEQVERKQISQERTDGLISNLESLDFGDDETVIDWIIGFQEASDQVGTRFDAKKVVSVFQQNGFQIGGIAGLESNMNAENFARHIIGNTLSFLNSSGWIHQVIQELTKEWKEKYGRNAKL